MPPPSARDWLDRADEDLLAISGMLDAERVAWGAVAFHAQQAAEKNLKVLLIERGIRPPLTHDRAELVQAVRKAGVDLPALATECAALESYVVDVRYPETIAIPGEKAGRVILAAGMLIVDQCRLRMTSGHQSNPASR